MMHFLCISLIQKYLIIDFHWNELLGVVPSVHLDVSFSYKFFSPDENMAVVSCKGLRSTSGAGAGPRDGEFRASEPARKGESADSEG